jgi:release factor glutamine methyltransferase
MVATSQGVGGLSRARAKPNRVRRLLRGAIHLMCYHLVLKRERTTTARAAGFKLVVRPTVFHPRLFLASEFFASFIARLDLAGRRVADVGTGSGILALAAARAGAASVVALDINPHAVRTTAENALANGYGKRVTAVCSDLFSALAPGPIFDVILSNPPYFPGEPIDLADRAWHAGHDYCDIASLFAQARDRLAPGGRFFVLLSSDSDLKHLRGLIRGANFRTRIVEKHSIFFETLIIYELQAK